MSPILFALFVDLDLELYLEDNPSCGLTIDKITLALIVFADDMVIFGKTVSDLQNSHNLLYEYCLKWGLEVNTTTRTILEKKSALNLSK